MWWQFNMNICVDVGNTLTKLALYNNDEFICRIVFATDLKKSKDEYVATINALLLDKKVDPKKEENHIIFSSVVPALSRTYLTAFKDVFNAKSLIVEPGIKTGLSLQIDNPNEVGGDLIAVLVGAKEKYGYPSVIVDLGTATKILVLNDKGAFITCLFIPGIEMSLHALSERAALLPKVGLKKPKEILEVKNTIDAMNTGIILAHTEMIDGIITKYEKALGYSLKRILTGGSAQIIKNYLAGNYIYDANLSLDGLLCILKKQK